VQSIINKPQGDRKNLKASDDQLTVQALITILLKRDHVSGTKEEKKELFEEARRT
jgi:hypothetical protein